MYVVILGTRCKSGKAWSETLYVDVGMGMPGRSGTACAHAHVLYTTCPRHLYYIHCCDPNLVSSAIPTFLNFVGLIQLCLEHLHFWTLLPSQLQKEDNC